MRVSVGTGLLLDPQRVTNIAIGLTQFHGFDTEDVVQVCGFMGNASFVCDCFCIFFPICTCFVFCVLCFVFVVLPFHFQAVKNADMEVLSLDRFVNSPFHIAVPSRAGNSLFEFQNHNTQIDSAAG